jgi:phage minor structural protein
MSYPILYSATETKFDHNGTGILSACVSCEVTEEANGIFELAMQYPMDGVHFAEIGDRAIIKAKADQFRQPQLFRVYAISKPMNGIVTVLAEHISYDLSGIPVKPFSAPTATSALSMLKSNAVVDCPFDFWTDKTTQANFKVSLPASIRSRLGGVAGSILDVYGGEYEFDNYTVKLHNNRGMNRGVSIRYGKNLTDIQQEQNCSSVATGVYPYWAGEVDEKAVLVELPERIVNAPGTYNFVKIRTVDFTESFEAQPTVEELRARTQSYIKSNNIGVPKISMTVSFAQLEQTEEYKHLKLLERVSLFDTVNVEFHALGVSATAKAVKIVYDAIADRVKSVTLGSVRANIADTIASQQQEISQKPNKTFMEIAIENLTKTILGARGGSVRFLDENGDGEPDTLYIADNPDPQQAVKVWRFNYEGWGASNNGYNGPFVLGATLNYGIVADFITAGTLNANLIKTGTISSDSGISINLDSGEISSTGVSNVFSLYGGALMATDGSPNPRVSLASQSYDTEKSFALMFDDGNGTSCSVGQLNGGLAFRCKDLNLGAFTLKNIGLKTISGEKVLVAYE